MRIGKAMSDPKITSLPNLQEIEREAAVWAVRLDSDDVPQSVWTEFEEWLRRSPQHREAADRFTDFWAGMAELEAFNDLAETEPVAKPRQLDAAARTRVLPRHSLIGGIAASIAVICGLAVYLLVATSDPNFDGSYRTAVGEQQTIDLPDGSTVVLNTDSMFEVDFSESERIIRLTQGEAFFDVKPDASKPFSVETNRGTVTAVGTAFSVRVNHENIGVLVTEGRVALRSMPNEQETAKAKSNIHIPDVLEVLAGQEAVFGDTEKKVDPVAPKEMERQLDWHDGLLSFHGERLSKVVSDISRYTDVTIEIADAQLAERRVVAYYQVGKIEPMFEALKLTANVRVERIDDRHVRLHQAQ